MAQRAGRTSPGRDKILSASPAGVAKDSAMAVASRAATKNVLMVTVRELEPVVHYLSRKNLHNYLIRCMPENVSLREKVPWFHLPSLFVVMMKTALFLIALLSVLLLVRGTEVCAIAHPGIELTIA